ncbi:MAG TPA: helix-turn-helix domain-containing protein [Anaeromyxobacteraceae bacterium]
MKPLAEQNLYEILEVPCDAPEDDIVRAWDRVSALCAPGALATYTLMPADDAALLGRRLEEALTILLDPTERQRYDAQLSPTPAPRPGGSDNASNGEVRPARRRLPPIIPARPVPPIVRALPSPADPPLTTAAAELTEAAASAGDPEPIPLQRMAAASVETASAVAPTAMPTPTPTPTAIPTATQTAPAAVQSAAAPRAVPISRPQELVVAEGTRFDGDMLRRAREQRGITLPQLCERTKISRHHVENLESGRYDKLPAAVYLRGILMALAKELRLDGQKVARSYLETMTAARPPASR